MPAPFIQTLRNIFTFWIWNNDPEISMAFRYGVWKRNREKRRILSRWLKYSHLKIHESHNEWLNDTWKAMWSLFILTVSSARLKGLGLL